MMMRTRRRTTTRAWATSTSMKMSLLMTPVTKKRRKTEPLATLDIYKHTQGFMEVNAIQKDYP